jgi:hypothetical protein
LEGTGACFPIQTAPTPSRITTAAIASTRTVQSQTREWLGLAARKHGVNQREG